MCKMIALIVAVTICFLSLTAAAQEQPKCAARDNVLRNLARKYHEVPVAIGVTNKGGLIEVLTTPDGSTWTIIVSTPQGISCLIAVGEDWRTMTPIISGPKA